MIDDCAEGSMGLQVQGWMDMAFPGQEISSIRMLKETHPGQFHGALLAAAQVEEHQ